MSNDAKEIDFAVIGGGMAGLCAAVAAARQGLRVVLAERDSHLGGDASGRVRRPIFGVDARGCRPFGRETGLLEEIRLENAASNPGMDWAAWDSLLIDFVRREPNILLLTGTELGSVSIGEGGFIERITLHCGAERLEFAARYFADCTGAGELGVKAGADRRADRESQSETGESLAPETPPVDHRGAYRLIGDLVLTENDLRECRAFEDAVAYGGWPLVEDYRWDESRLRENPELWLERPYGIPLRCLYSRSTPNLFMAGRTASVTAVALRSTGVMGTGALMGQAIGIAAALCRARSVDPHTLARDHIPELRRALCRSDLSLPGAIDDDPADLARLSRAVATSKLGAEFPPSNVINGMSRPTHDWPQMWASDPKTGLPTNIEIDFVERRTVDAVVLTFDTGLHRPLTQTDDPIERAKMAIAPQPETVRDYTLLVGLTTRWNPIVEIRGNTQRRRLHRFEAVRVNRLRLVIEATNGVDHARIVEIACYHQSAPRG